MQLDKENSSVNKKNKQIIKQLSIIIVNWNNEALLKNCLDSIFKTHHNRGYEIIVVDNHSADDSVTLIKKKYPEIRLIKNKENYGFARANNQAIKIARGNYLLLLNNDTLVTEDNCFSRMVQVMQDHPEIGVLGCRLYYPDGTLQSAGEEFPSAWNVFRNQILFMKSWQRLKDNNKIGNGYKKTDYVCGACLMTSQKIIKQVGMLQEDYFMYGEDVEFCYRVEQAGYEVGIINDISIVHLHSKSTEKNIIEILKHSISNDLKNIRILYSSNFQLWLARLFYSVGLLIRAFLAIFRRDKRAGDYLKLLQWLLSGKGIETGASYYF